MSGSTLRAVLAQWRARIRMRWGRFSDDHLEVIEGRRDLLAGQLQTQGLTPEQAEQQIAQWEHGQAPPDEAKLRGAR